MSRDVTQASGLIGPNAILQTLPVLDRLLGRKRRSELMSRAGIADIPDGTEMIPEALAAALHRRIRQDVPELAAQVSAQAGHATANYILLNRIPKPAQVVLQCLPAGASALEQSKAIEKHAWTFAGTGQFTVTTPWAFKIRSNPLIRGETSPACLCDWHAAVFTRLYQKLVSRKCTCREVSCGAQGSDRSCEFEIQRAPRAR